MLKRITPTNAPRLCALADLLVMKPATIEELATDLGVSVDNAAHIMRRLRDRGLPITETEDLAADSRYRLLYPRGRICAVEGCGTILRRSNPSARCELHGGGFLDLTSMPSASEAGHCRSRDHG